MEPKSNTIVIPYQHEQEGIWRWITLVTHIIWQKYIVAEVEQR
jgi:hypothetical protein